MNIKAVYVGMLLLAVGLLAVGGTLLITTMGGVPEPSEDTAVEEYVSRYTADQVLSVAQFDAPARSWELVRWRAEYIGHGTWKVYRDKGYYCEVALFSEGTGRLSWMGQEYASTPEGQKFIEEWLRTEEDILRLLEEAE